MIEIIRSKFNSQNAFTQKVILLTLVFLVYALICRLLNIYFFWESKILAGLLFFKAVILICNQDIKDLRAKQKSALNPKIFRAIAVFALGLKCMLLLYIPQTVAYTVAKNYIYTNAAIKEQVGKVTNMFLEANGSFSLAINNEGETGIVDMNFIIKGSKKNIDLNLLLEKEKNTDWQVTPVEEINN